MSNQVGVASGGATLSFWLISQISIQNTFATVAAIITGFSTLGVVVVQGIAHLKSTRNKTLSTENEELRGENAGLRKEVVQIRTDLMKEISELRERSEADRRRQDFRFDQMANEHLTAEREREDREMKEREDTRNTFRDRQRQIEKDRDTSLAERDETISRLENINKSLRQSNGKLLDKLNSIDFARPSRVVVAETLLEEADSARHSGETSGGEPCPTESDPTS